MTTLPKILYIDDEAINLRLFKISFKGSYDIYTANSGEEALEIIKNESFDIILSDQRMPGMDGTEFMNLAKEILPNAKYILLTGYTDIEALETAINEIGIWQYVKKPWEASNLKFVIDNAFNTLNTEREKTEITKKLEQSEERLSLALEGTKAGVWDWNLKSNKTYYSTTWKEMLGYSEDELPNDVQIWEKLLHPDDLPKAYAAIDQYIKGLIPKYEIEFRMRHKNGEWVHILSRAKGEKDATGEYCRMIGTHIDLTEKYTIQEQITKLNEELEERVERRTQALKLLNIQLIQRNKFEHLISKISSELIGLNEDEIDDKININLGEICNFNKSSGAFVIALDQQGNKFELQNYFSSLGKEAHLRELLEKSPVEDLLLLKEKLGLDDPVIIKDIAQIPADFSIEKEIFSVLSIKSLILLPLKAKNKNFGFFGIFQSGIIREWNQEDLSLLKFTGEIFSNTFQRRSGERAILDRERKLSQAYDVISINEKRTKLLQKISSIANSPIPLSEALSMCLEIILNHGKGVMGLIVKQNNGYTLVDTIAKTESDKQDLKFFFQKENNGILPILDQVEYEETPIFLENIKFNLNEQSFFQYNYNISAFPIKVGNKTTHTFIAFFPPSGKEPIEQGLIREIALQISFMVERDLTQKELNRSLQKEKDLGVLKSQFISMASHQFRTPLTVIKSNVELFQMLADGIGDQLKNKVDNLSVRIIEEVDRLTALMNDVLLLGKLNANVLEANKEIGNIFQLTQDITDKVSSIQSDGRKASIHTKGTIKEIPLDDKLFAHAYTNLIENAFKYSKNSEPPHVTMNFQTDKTFITVQDFGRGIPAKELNNLFQPFYRAENTADIEGTGLGLVISKEYIELQGGTISVNSILDEGTSFTIELPNH